MVYTTKTRGKIFNFKSYETKLHEGYSNDIRPLDAYGRSFDSHKSRARFRTNGVTMKQDLMKMTLFTMWLRARRTAFCKSF